MAQADEAGMQTVLEREQKKYAAAPKPVVPDVGSGQRNVSPVTETRPARNPAAEIFYLDESQMPKPDESAEEYKRRRLRESKP